MAKGNLPYVLNGEGDILCAFMASVTVAVGGKGHIPFMTGTARFQLCHVNHGITLAFAAADKDTAVAIVAPVYAEVELMAEKGVGCLEGNILRGLVAFGAIALDRKTGTAVVTGAAGFSLHHIAHGEACTPGSGNKELVVAVGTFVHIQVKFMAEKSICIKGNVLYRMALGATFLDAERCFPVMAGSARSAFLHLRHGNVRVAGTGLEQLVVTLAAAVHSQMEIVAED